MSIAAIATGGSFSQAVRRTAQTMPHCLTFPKAAIRGIAKPVSVSAGSARLDSLLRRNEPKECAMTDCLARTLPAAAPILGGIAALSLISAAPVTAQESEEDAPEAMTKGEESLARMLEGRVEGKPQDCIRALPSQPVRTIEETAYVYGRGKTIYVQRTKRPEDIDRDDIVVVQRFDATRLCRQDFATTIDRFQGFFTGGLQFDEFVPYTRVDNEDG
jgi:hypothetical protein